MKPKRGKSQLMAIKKRAWFLIVIKGMEQKEVARMLDITENTICFWKKKFDWKAEINAHMKEHKNIDSYIREFFMLFRAKHKEAADLAEKTWEEYVEMQTNR